MTRRSVGIALAATLMAAPALAQRGAALVTGTVIDSTTSRPLGGAIVALAGGARSTRTDDRGGFMIVVSQIGEVVLEVRRIGYAPRRASVQITPDVQELSVTVALTRVAALDTVRVIAARRALYGVVGASEDLRPLADADVELLGAGRKTRTNANGRFFIEVVTGRSYLVRAKRPGFAPRTMSVSIPDSGALDVALLLDSGVVYPKRLFSALDEFDLRVKWRTLISSALVPSIELARNPRADIVWAVRNAPSFGSKTLRFGPSVCIFVDGMPRPGIQIASLDVTQIEFIETYTASGDYTRKLDEDWGAGHCSDTGVPVGEATRGRTRPRGTSRTSNRSTEIVYMVVWLKR